MHADVNRALSTTRKKNARTSSGIIHQIKKYINIDRKKDYNVTYKLVLYDIKSVVRSPIQTDRSIILWILIRPVVVFLSEVSTLYHS